MGGVLVDGVAPRPLVVGRWWWLGTTPSWCSGGKSGGVSLEKVGPAGGPQLENNQITTNEIGLKHQ